MPFDHHQEEDTRILMEKCTIEEGSPSQLTWYNTLNIITSKGIIKKKFQEVAV
jgi:hypothetical protein